MSRRLLLGAALALAGLALAGGRTAAPAPPPAAGVADSVDAERGAELFRIRGCAACHTVGLGPRVGPDLAGVTARREPEWILAMITRPDSMLAADVTARGIGSRYPATMPRLGIGRADARDLVAFLAGAAGVRVPEPEERPGIGPGRCPHPHGCGAHAWGNSPRREAGRPDPGWCPRPDRRPSAPSLGSGPRQGGRE